MAPAPGIASHPANTRSQPAGCEDHASGVCRSSPPDITRAGGCSRAQVADYRRAASALDGCASCFASSRRPRHLTIAIGQTCYVMLPPRCLVWLVSESCVRGQLCADSCARKAVRPPQSCSCMLLHGCRYRAWGLLPFLTPKEWVHSMTTAACTAACILRRTMLQLQLGACLRMHRAHFLLQPQAAVVMRPEAHAVLRGMAAGGGWSPGTA